ncbi:hypothetical protein L479_03039 [Exiguobacterium sp. S17]|nr:hypothetical protein L479_03039 [Exiguobacterium sp. S17]
MLPQVVDGRDLAGFLGCQNRATIFISGEGATFAHALPEDDLCGEGSRRATRPAPERQVVRAAEVLDRVDLAVCDLMAAQHKRFTVGQVIGGEGLPVPIGGQVFGVSLFDELAEKICGKSSADRN